VGRLLSAYPLNSEGVAHDFVVSPLHHPVMTPSLVLIDQDCGATIFDPLSPFFDHVSAAPDSNSFDESRSDRFPAL